MLENPLGFQGFQSEVATFQTAGNLFLSMFVVIEPCRAPSTTHLLTGAAVDKAVFRVGVQLCHAPPPLLEPEVC